MRGLGVRLWMVAVVALVMAVGCSDDGDGSAGEGEGADPSGTSDTHDDHDMHGAAGDGAADDLHDDHDMHATSDGDDATQDAHDDHDVHGMMHIGFEAMVGDAAFACDQTYEGLGSSDARAEPLDFRLYVHDVRLLSGDDEIPLELADSDWQHGGVALLDFEDASGTCQNGTAETNTMIMGAAPDGDYDGIAFTVGVPVPMNHDDPASAASPMNVTALHWNWNGGYKFMRLDMRVMLDDPDTDAGPTTPYNFHLGSTVCTGDAPTGEDVSCDNANRPEVTLPDFDPATDTIVLDYAALVAGEDLQVDEGGKPGCMSFPGDMDCPALFENLGLDYDTGEAVGDQAVFSVK